MNSAAWVITHVGEQGPFDNLERYVRRSASRKGGDGFKDEAYGVEVLMSGLEGMVRGASPLEFHIMPNFNFGWLRPSTGWAVKLSKTAQFNCDLFRAEEFFRCVTLVEIATEPDFERFREICLKCIPTEKSEARVLDFKDNEGSGWTPLLVKRGGAIRYMRAKQHLDDVREEKDRHFLLCDGGLPDEALDYIQEFMREASARNARLTEEVDIARGVDAGGILTNEALFSSEELRLEQFRDCAKEQNVRLLGIVLRGLGMEPLYSKLEPRLETPKPFADSRPTNEDYAAIERAEKGGTEKKGVAATIADALKQWPRGAPIYPFSVEKKSGFPLGDHIYRLYLKTFEQNKEGLMSKQVFDALMETEELLFIPAPESFLPDCVMCYNDFEILYNGDIVYRSMCADVKNRSGLLKKYALTKGFDLINSPVAGKDLAKEWRNNHLDSFPVVEPFESDPNKVLGEDMKRRFFAHEDPPNQLKGFYHQEVATEAAKDSLGVLGMHHLRLEPIFTFLSKGVPSEPGFEIEIG